MYAEYVRSHSLSLIIAFVWGYGLKLFKHPYVFMFTTIYFEESSNVHVLRTVNIWGKPKSSFLFRRHMTYTVFVPNKQMLMFWVCVRISLRVFRFQNFPLFFRTSLRVFRIFFRIFKISLRILRIPLLLTKRLAITLYWLFHALICCIIFDSDSVISMLIAVLRLFCMLELGYYLSKLLLFCPISFYCHVEKVLLNWSLQFYLVR
jgi:hypothetical protein